MVLAVIWNLIYLTKKMRIKYWINALLTWLRMKIFHLGNKGEDLRKRSLMEENIVGTIKYLRRLF